MRAAIRSVWYTPIAYGPRPVTATSASTRAVGVCGFRAECRVQNHMAMCYCPEGYKGDPFAACAPVPVTKPPREPVKTDPCYPSPCESNAECTSKQDDDDHAVATCKCRPGFPKGDPYTACRPECVNNADCPQKQALRVSAEVR